LPVWPKPRRRMPAFQRKRMERCRPVVEALEEIARAHGATASQVALAWVVQFHGETVVAIPGATSVSQAASNAAAGDLRLSGAELARIDELSRAVLRGGLGAGARRRNLG